LLDQGWQRFKDTTAIVIRSVKRTNQDRN